MIVLLRYSFRAARFQKVGLNIMLPAATAEDKSVSCLVRKVRLFPTPQARLGEIDIAEQSSHVGRTEIVGMSSRRGEEIGISLTGWTTRQHGNVLSILKGWEVAEVKLSVPDVAGLNHAGFFNVEPSQTFVHAPYMKDQRASEMKGGDQSLQMCWYNIFFQICDQNASHNILLTARCKRK